MKIILHGSVRADKERAANNSYASVLHAKQSEHLELH
jgi:hypothetical protein